MFVYTVFVIMSYKNMTNFSRFGRFWFKIAQKKKKSLIFDKNLSYIFITNLTFCHKSFRLIT